MARLAKLFRSFRDDRGGNVAVIFAIALLPVLTLVAMAIDFSNFARIRAFSQNALDSGVMRSIKADPEGFVAEDPQWRRRFADYTNEMYYKNNISHEDILAGGLYDILNSEVGGETVREGQINNAKVKSFFPNLTEQDGVKFNLKSELRVSKALHHEIIVLLDNSASMLIAATPEGRRLMLEKTRDFRAKYLADRNFLYRDPDGSIRRRPADSPYPALTENELRNDAAWAKGESCEFACHSVQRYNNLSSIAEANNIKLRFDVAKEALMQLADKVESYNSRSTSGKIKLGLVLGASPNTINTVNMRPLLDTNVFRRSVTQAKVPDYDRLAPDHQTTQDAFTNLWLAISGINSRQYPLYRDYYDGSSPERAKQWLIMVSDGVMSRVVQERYFGRGVWAGAGASFTDCGSIADYYKVITITVKYLAPARGGPDETQAKFDNWSRAFSECGKYGQLKAEDSADIAAQLDKAFNLVTNKVRFSR
jgi:hypothetical protein